MRGVWGLGKRGEAGDRGSGDDTGRERERRPALFALNFRARPQALHKKKIYRRSSITSRSSPFQYQQVGLDAAGKTTILYKLKLGEIVTTIPTIGESQ